MTDFLTDGTHQDWVERFRSHEGDYSNEPEDDTEWEAWFDGIQQERYFASLVKHGNLPA
jgi:hypothetical protein